MKRLGAAAVIVGLAAYAVAFYATPLPSVRGDAGQPLLRIELLVQLLLWPEEWLFPNWFGTPPAVLVARSAARIARRRRHPGLGLGSRLAVDGSLRGGSRAGPPGARRLLHGRRAERPQHVGAAAGLVRRYESAVDVYRSGVV